ncbi:jg7631 [Pararge aegeria aegeria]|uniref:Jg7631 protein n=1 Tax=Pararge aegeria aegeria TaxID=348720 RepID=A0A8S4RGP3_9NEOP|nr:jg7631 [Pararge aegeria aegeria]
MVGAAVTSAEQDKRRKYENLDSRFIFLPFGVETLGPWGPEARALFKESSKRVIRSLPVILERAATLANELVWPSKGAMRELRTVPRCGGFKDVLDLFSYK